MQELEQLRFCAFCPNPCRRAWPADMAAQNEAITSSALSTLAMQAAEGRIAFDDDVRALLMQQEMAHVCRPACPYGLDVPALVNSVIRTLEGKSTDAGR